MKRILLCGLAALTLVVGLCDDASAARRVSYKGDNVWLITYSVGVPFEDTKDYVAQTSWLGFSIEGRQFVNGTTTVGISAGWQTLDERAYRTSQLGSATTVTGTQYRYQNVFPALATAHLYFGSPETAKLYVGGGVGAYWIERRTEVGLYAFTEKNWHFGVAPEVGLVMPSGSTSWVVFARYHYAFEAGDQAAQQWLTIQVGLQYN